MRTIPTFHHHLPARRAGSFRVSQPGRIAETVTLTWFRFELLLAWFATVLFGLATPAAGSAILILVLSPLMALALWVLIKLTGWVFYFVPGMNRIWGWGRLLFLTAFSRLVVEDAPKVELPFWNR